MSNVKRIISRKVISGISVYNRVQNPRRNIQKEVKIQKDMKYKKPQDTGCKEGKTYGILPSLPFLYTPSLTIQPSLSLPLPSLPLHPFPHHSTLSVSPLPFFFSFPDVTFFPSPSIFLVTPL